MGYHPRMETSEVSSFQTTRTRNSELWFIRNKKLEEAILGNAAKCQKRYGVKIYALAIEGNHVHSPAHFPKANRASFMRDFNSAVARAVPRYTPEFSGGRLWARRYSAEMLPGDEDVEEYFFYTVLQPVKDGHAERLSEYRGYNCFHDATNGIKRKFKLVNWRAYNEARRYRKRVRISDFLQEYELEYARLPGYEHLSQKAYAKRMREKLEARRKEIVADRRAKGLGFAGPKALGRIPRGAAPKSTKTSTIKSHRPRVLSVCPVRRQECLTWYFEFYYSFREASKEYRAGNSSVKFPVGSYKPILCPQLVT